MQLKVWHAKVMLEQLFCPNIDCPARGQVNQGNLSSHSQIEKRCLCTVCNKSFAITKGTLFYRLRTDPKIVMWVIVLLAYGCPTQAIVKAFGFDERTVKNWWQRAGRHCEEVHEHLIGQSQLDLQQVQADEIKAKILGGSLWLAMAIMVPTRLWLGAVASPQRDLELIQSLADRIRAMALCRPLLLAADSTPDSMPDRLARHVHFITGLQESTVFSSVQDLITCFLKSH